MRPAASPGVGPGLLARPRSLAPSVSVRGARNPNARIGRRGPAPGTQPLGRGIIMKRSP
jgi:hypothetical protein